MDISAQIDRSSPVPFYFQLQRILQTWIEENGILPNTLLPSEAELCKKFDVSRTVVRQTLSELERLGLIYRVKGQGSFVAEPKLRRKIVMPAGFSEDMRRIGLSPGGRVMRQEMVPVTEVAAQQLNLPINSKVFCLERTRFADQVPIGIEQSYLNFKGCETLLKEDLENRSLYELLLNKYQLTFLMADLEIIATLLRSPESELLNTFVHAPGLLVRRTTYDTNRQPFEYSKCLYHGDKYRFTVTLMQ